MFYLVIGLLIVFVTIAYFLSNTNRSQTRLEQTNEYRFKADKFEVLCAVCGGKTFDEKQVKMNSTFLTFLNLDWANRNATALECQSCGHIMWFSQSVHKMDDT